MATRIYLPSSGAAPVTPSTWNFPTQAATTYTYAASLTKLSTAFATRSGATGTTNPTHRGLLRYVLGPLAAQTISGTVKGQIRCYENNGGANATLAAAIKIVQPDGSDRAVLLSYTAADTFTDGLAPEFDNALRNATIRDSSESASPTLTTQDAQAGDYLVIELGWRSATTSSRTIYQRVGDASSNDLAENETDSTNDYCPWVEFSADLGFATGKASTDATPIAAAEAVAFPDLPYSGTDLIPLGVVDQRSSFRFVLYQGVTPISTQYPNLTGDYGDFAFTLTAEERAQVTDPLTLRFGYIANGSRVRVSWAELATPGSSSTAKSSTDTLEVVVTEYAAGGEGEPKTSSDTGEVAISEYWDLVVDIPWDGLTDAATVDLAESGSTGLESELATQSSTDATAIAMAESAVVADTYVLATITLTDRTPIAAAESSTLSEAFVDRMTLGTADVFSGSATINVRDALPVVTVDVLGLPQTASSADALGGVVAESYLKLVLGTQSSLLINGIDRTDYVRLVDGVRISYSLNERGQASVTFLPGYVPERLDEIAIYAEDGVTQLFGGFVMQRRMEGFHPQALASVTICDCVDYSVMLDWNFLSLTYAVEVTLQTVLADLVAALPIDYGITLDATDYSGTTLAPFTWTTLRASDALRELSNRTGRTWGVTTSRVLSMPSLPTGSAPENYADAATLPFELVWNDPDEVPANTVLLSCGPTGQMVYNQRWTATGSATSWVADIAAVGPGGYWLVNFSPSWPGVGDNGTVGVGAMFSWDWTTRTLTSNIGPPAAGTILSFPYTAQYPFTVSATTGETPEVQMLAQDEAITEYARGVEVAAGLLDQIAGQPRELTFRSHTHGWRPGQSLTIAVTGRAFNAQAVVKVVAISYGDDLSWWYMVTATESTVYTGSYLDQWRALVSGGTSSPVLVVTGIPSAAPADVPPLSLYMGGSDSSYHAGDGTSWFSIPGYVYHFTVGEYYSAKLPQVRARVWHSSTDLCSYRLYNLTTAAVAGTGTMTNTTPTEVEFDVTLANGRNEYVVQVQPANGQNAWVSYAVLETLG